MSIDAHLRVILVNYHCVDNIARHLQSGVLNGCDTIIVDNASDPELVQRLADDHGGRALLMDTNVGFAAAVNAASSLGEPSGWAHDAVVLLNPDVSVTRADLDALYALLSERNADAVGPKLVDEGERIWVSSAGGPLSLRSVVWYFLFISHMLPRLSGFFWTRRQIRRPLVDPPHWLCGACLMLRADAFERFGYLPTAEIVYGEDVAWGVKATELGARLILARDITLTHIGGQSGGSQVWVDATIRTMRRHLGPARGSLAAATVRTGLWIRRLLGRPIR